ncbi:unnamed protein product [Prorocentrum cordatum]|nr:unnamed protein product [Polarella glacialis]
MPGRAERRSEDAASTYCPSSSSRSLVPCSRGGQAEALLGRRANLWRGPTHEANYCGRQRDMRLREPMPGTGWDQEPHVYRPREPQVGAAARSDAERGAEGAAAAPASSSSPGSSLLPPRKYEPAKVVSSDGTVRLRGVRSSNNVGRLAREVEPFSREAGLAPRVEVKSQSFHRQRQRILAAQTWGALHSWRSVNELEHHVRPKGASKLGALLQ